MLSVIKQGQFSAEKSYVRIPAEDGFDVTYAGDEEEKAVSQSLEDSIQRAEEEIQLRQAQFDALIERRRDEAEDFVRQMQTRAEQERDQILEQAKRSSIQMMEEARLEGIEKGFRERTAEIDAVLKKMLAALDSLKKEQEEYFRTYATQTQDFALEIAGKILHKQITLEPTALESLVIETIGGVRDADWLTVKLASRSGELIKLLNDYYHQTDARKITFTENRSVDPGACVVETPDGTVDASIQTQLDNLRQLFQKVSK